MISKNEILTLSQALSLNPDTVEKDYVLSWVLWGINNDKDLSHDWAFKGGTCLKKCFFETFRFSEDLDFTVIRSEHFSENFLLNKFKDISGAIYEETGIEFLPNEFKFEILPKENKNFSAQGKIQYYGPLRRRNGVASIKLDLTADEIMVLHNQKRAGTKK